MVKPGTTLNVEKLPGQKGSALTVPDVLLVAASEDGEDAVVSTGQPVGSVTATILEQGKADKVRVVKFKPKVRYRRVHGHRQQFTKIRIEEIRAPAAP